MSRKLILFLYICMFLSSCQFQGNVGLIASVSPEPTIENYKFTQSSEMMEEVQTSIPTISTDINLLTPSKTNSLGITPDPTTTKFATVNFLTENGRCIGNYDEFPYAQPFQDNENKGKVYPLPPWQLVKDFSTIEDEEYRNWLVAAVQTSQQDQEIWLREPFDNGTELIIFQPKSNDWNIISARIENYNGVVEELFVTSNGNVWGKTYWLEDHNDENATVLTKFNDKTQRFEFVLETPTIPPVSEGESYHWSDQPQFVLDEEDTFWFVMQKDGLFSFDTTTMKLTKHIDLPPMPAWYMYVSELLIGPNQILYFAVTGPTGHRSYIYQFDPALKELKLRDSPFGTWGFYGGVFVDFYGRLWLGMMAYQKFDGEWKILHPNTDTFVKEFRYYSYLPSLILGSSDGKMWLTKVWDNSDIDGTAWFDPNTGNGCVFTNIPVWDILEDSEQNLWLIADNKLYKMKMNT